MIVKNESKIITRCFDAVLPIIDTYCICDTGSTDNTVQLIKDYFDSKNIQGVVFEEPFKNFGYNRTVAYERTKGMATYALFVDADMILKIKPEFKKEDLTDDVYSIIQKNSAISYYNVRLAKTDAGIKCVAPTHEYYDVPHGKSQGKLQTLYIEDIGDGGAKADKFERDIRLLSEDLAENPKNPRSHFYIANSYKDLRKYDEAIKHYEERIQIGGWHEECWQSAVNIGHCYISKNEKEKALWWFLRAYDIHPKRAENLYEVTKLFREKGLNKVGYKFYELAKEIPYPKDDVLFIQDPVYNFLLDYEASILNYYVQKPTDHLQYLRLLGYEYNADNILSNYKFYKQVLKQKAIATHDYTTTTEYKAGKYTLFFQSSSPSILKVCSTPCNDGANYIMNQRFVNYKIRPDGSYHIMHPEEKITTRNAVVYLDESLKVILKPSQTKEPNMIPEDTNSELRYDGTEDVRLIYHNNQIHFYGTMQHPTTKHITCGSGIYHSDPPSFENPTPIQSPMNRDCEKNWEHFVSKDDELLTIYEWYPLTIGKQDGDKLSIVSRKEQGPKWVKRLRGSSPGVRVGDEYYFLCHIVSYENPRCYYHVFVTLDANTLTYKRHSSMFSFEGEQIEYGLGLVVEDDRVLVSYSTWDRTSKVAVYPRTLVEEMLVPFA